MKEMGIASILWIIQFLREHHFLLKRETRRKMEGEKKMDKMGAEKENNLNERKEKIFRLNQREEMEFCFFSFQSTKGV